MKRPNQRVLTLAIAFVLAACAGPQTAPTPTQESTFTALPPTPAPTSSTTPEPMDLSQKRFSIYISLASDQGVAQRTILLTTQLALEQPDWVYLETDGSYAPLAAESAATVYVQIDGKRATNKSTIDWRGSLNAVRHTFNAVGAAYLAAGDHTVELVAEPLAGSFEVAALSNLSVFVHPSEKVAVAELEAQAGPFEYTTLGQVGPDLPHDPLVAITADVSNPIVALASGTTRIATHAGDPMLGIYLDGQHPGNASSLWTVNDAWEGAELEGPMFTHALLSGGGHDSSVSLDATEFAWSLPPPALENPAIYVVPPSATLVVLSEGMQIIGKANSLLQSYSDQLGTVSDYWCIGSSSAWPDCPSVGTDVLLAEQTIIVPDNHSGVVMFVAKTRCKATKPTPAERSNSGFRSTGFVKVQLVYNNLPHLPQSVSERLRRAISPPETTSSHPARMSFASTEKLMEVLSTLFFCETSRFSGSTDA